MNSKRDGLTMKRVFLSADKRAVEFFEILYEIFMVLYFELFKYCIKFFKNQNLKNLT
jgi:hypothetical protein